MARTKRGTKLASNGFRSITVRMPDGEQADTVGFRFKEFWVVVVPYDCEGSKRKFDFENGLRKGEFGLYIRQRSMWLYRRSEQSMKLLRLVFKAYIYWAFDGRMSKFRACLDKMKVAPSRKRARAILDFYTKKYGFWSFGWFYLTRTQGYDELLERKDEFANLYWQQKPIIRLPPRLVFCEDRSFWPR